MCTQTPFNILAFNNPIRSNIERDGPATIRWTIHGVNTFGNFNIHCPFIAAKHLPKMQVSPITVNTTWSQFYLSMQYFLSFWDEFNILFHIDLLLNFTTLWWTSRHRLRLPWHKVFRQWGRLNLRVKMATASERMKILLKGFRGIETLCRLMVTKDSHVANSGSEIITTEAG